MPSPERWYRNVDQLQKFESALIEAGEFEELDELHYFHFHPEDWNAEYAYWKNEADSPMNEHDDNWKEFIGFLNERE